MTITDPVIFTLMDYVSKHEQYGTVRGVIGMHGGTWLREYRERRNISLREFAKQLDISFGYLSKVERGAEILSAELAAKFVAWHAQHRFEVGK